MSDPGPVPAAAAAGEPVAYRPVSGLAIAGLILSGLFAAWVISAGLVAFRAGTPFLMDPASLVLPLVGFALSLSARIQIRRSEGTRAGLPLATWGMWLSVFFGLGYAAYRGATEYALRLQAKEFTNGWFELLRGNDVDAHAAFYDSLDPTLRDQRFDLDNPELRQRLKDNPEQWSKVQKDIHRRFFWGEGRGGAPQKGLLPRFFAHELVDTVRQAGKAAQVEAQGIRTWEHVGGSMPGYRVEQNYRVATPDSELDVAVTLLGTDDQSTGRRRWRVVLEETGIRDPGRKWTPRGQAVAQLRVHSQRFAAEWAKELVQGELNEGYLNSCPPSGRDALRFAYLLTNPVFLPGYPQFVQGRILQAKGLVTDPKIRDAVLKEAQALFQGLEPDARTAMQVADPRSSGRYELGENTGELRFLHPLELRFVIYQKGPLQLPEKIDCRCEGTIIVATRSPAALAAVAGVNGNPPQGPDALRLAGQGHNVSWWIVAMELELAVAVPKTAGRPGS